MIRGRTVANDLLAANAIVRSSFGLVLAFIAMETEARIHCASDLPSLAAAIEEAGTSEEDVEIRIVSGTYSAPAGGWTLRVADTSGSLAKNVSISGGWDPSCESPDPAGATTLDGNHAHRILSVQQASTLYWTGSLTIESLVLARGAAQCGGALRIDGAAHSGALVLDRLIFDRNGGGDGAALCANNRGPIALSNSIIANSQSAGMTAFVSAAAGAPLSVLNNTVVDNSGPSGIHGIFLQRQYGGPLTVANNVFWNNTTGNQPSVDVHCEGPMSASVVTNIATHVLCGSTSSGNFTQPPLLDAQWRPTASSPARDAGTDVGLNGLDVRGKPRVQGAAIDLGAIESSPDPLFADGFEPAD